ncbi:MAG TPA: GSU2403 family nucleotidyltransferase fold protein [Ramlibacter sp.]|nr:GSU2403 family nucleotidyltransferase fold protein [Ramlibacter sp.]
MGAPQAKPASAGFVFPDHGFFPGKNVSLALPTNMQVDIHDAISSLEMGLLPAKSLTTPHSATYLTRGGELRVDLLTTAGRNDAVYRHNALNVNLEPLKFMEFSLEKTTQTVAISGEDALTVNIPSPMRYCLHKLLVMAERQEQFRAKLQKDAAQVAALASLGMQRMPRALQDAAGDIMGRGKGWRTRVRDGLDHLASFHPEIAIQLAAVLRIEG